ncbi:MAG: ATP-binding protein [Planctomycetia bacterium]|nr:ATP-binding protein [Planctomycetia bacterium]
MQEAAGHQLSHIEFLELILQDELLVRDGRQIARRVKAAQFRDLKALDNFDWSFNRRSRANNSSTWPLVASSARLATCCSSGRPARASRSLLKQSAIWRSSRA